MPKKGYNFNNIESVASRFVSSTNHPTISVLNDLKKELNSLFTEAKCEEIIYTKNTDKLFFGASVMPVINNEETLDIVLGDHDIKIKSYYLELDSKLLMLNLTAKEFTAILLHEIGHMVIDDIPVKRVRENIDKYFQDKDKILDVKASAQYTQLLNFAVKDTLKKVTSIRYRNNEEVFADSFVVMCGYGDALQTAESKITSNIWSTTVGVKEPKLVILDWVFRVYTSMKFARIPAIKTLQKSKSYTGSILEKKEIDKVIAAIQRIDTDMVEESTYLEESARRKNSLFKRLKVNGLRSIEDDLYEFRMRAKNVETEDEAMYTLRQINTRLTILDDYIRYENIDDSEREKYIEVMNNFREIRDFLSKKKIYNRKNYGLWYSYNQLDSEDKMY